MGLINRLFGYPDLEENVPDIVFGRYTDAYKQEEKYDAWDAALTKFDEQEYLECYRLFFDYLLDNKQNNLNTWEDAGVRYFEILQGSKMITGHINNTLIKAEAKVAKAKTLSIGFLRRMVEKNFSMKYSRYALDKENNLTLVFDSYLLDGSPYKLYYALKEIAVHADKQDDLLIEEFDSLQPINVGHIKDIEESHKEAKYTLLINKISKTLDLIRDSKINADQYPGAIGYQLLDMAYRLDFLIKPEGQTTEALERIHRIYFAPDKKSLEEKNHLIIREFEAILKRPKSDFFKELYTAAYSFGITSPANHSQLVDIINNELPNIEWYLENKFWNVALALPGYIVGYSLFNYAFPKPDRDLLFLYYQIMEPEYFSTLGYQVSYFDIGSGQLNKKRIKRALEKIENDNASMFPRFNIKSAILDFDSLPGFAKSYLIMFKSLDLTKRI